MVPRVEGYGKFTQNSDLGEGERADADELRSLMEELGVAKCPGSTAELISRASVIARDARLLADLHDTIPSSHEEDNPRHLSRA